MTIMIQMGFEGDIDEGEAVTLHASASLRGCYAFLSLSCSVEVKQLQMI